MADFTRSDNHYSRLWISDKCEFVQKIDLQLYQGSDRDGESREGHANAGWYWQTDGVVGRVDGAAQLMVGLLMPFAD